MTEGDRKLFLSVYSKLAAAFRQRIDANDVKVYYAVLEDLSIEAVSEAALILAREGSTDNWMPKAPEWYDLASSIDVRRDEVEARAALKPSAEEVASDMERIVVARAQFVKKCREVGAHKTADFFERLELRHPSEDPESPVCATCDDTGRVYDDDGRWGKRCACAETNPVLRAMARRAKHRQRLVARARRAADLAPSRRQPALTQVAGFG